MFLPPPERRKLQRARGLSDPACPQLSQPLFDADATNYRQLQMRNHMVTYPWHLLVGAFSIEWTFHSSCSFLQHVCIDHGG
jgi:hypothetical protein